MHTSEMKPERKRYGWYVTWEHAILPKGLITECKRVSSQFCDLKEWTFVNLSAHPLDKALNKLYIWCVWSELSCFKSSNIFFKDTTKNGSFKNGTLLLVTFYLTAIWTTVMYCLVNMLYVSFMHQDFAKIIISFHFLKNGSEILSVNRVNIGISV